MYYCVANGRQPGIYLSWSACKQQVFKFSGAKYKKISSITEAKNYMKSHCMEEWEFEDKKSSNQITNYFSSK